MTFNKIWIREYLSCILGNVFVVVQICLALFLVNIQVGAIALETEHLKSMAATDSDTYLFQYAMAAEGLYDVEADYEEACEKIRSLPGVAGMGELFDQSVSVAGDSEKYPDDEYSMTGMDSIVTSAVTYRMKEGRWLDGSDQEGGTIHAVLGGAIADRYSIGDILTIELENVEGSQNYEVEVVGKLADHCNVLDLSTLSEGQEMYSFMQEKPNGIFVNHRDVFGRMKKAGFGNSTAHCVVNLDSDADKDFLSGYGKIVSFDEMKRETEEWLHEFLARAVEEMVLWAVVIIFGIIASSYLVGKRRRYVWGIYLVLGEKPGRLLKIQMISNGIAYTAGALISLAAYRCYYSSMETSMMADICRYHIITDLIFLAIMLVISLVSNWYIMKIEPKEILTQTKE